MCVPVTRPAALLDRINRIIKIGRKDFATGCSHPVNPVNPVYGLFSAGVFGLADNSSFGVTSYSGFATPSSQ